VGDGEDAFVGDFGGVDFSCCRFDKLGADGAARGGGGAIDESVVDAFDRVAEELGFEGVVGAVVFGEDEQAGGVFVEAVDEADSGARVGLLEVGADEGQEGLAFFAGGGGGEEAGGFVDDQEVVVFVEDVEPCEGSHD